MPDVCPCCRRPLPSPEDQQAERLAELRNWCEQRGIWLGPGDEIDQDNAAAILGKKPSTLKWWRSQRIGPPHRKTAGGAVRYRLADLAACQLQDVADE
jgi:hypothetical protein